jgi:hypothetical protein
MLINIFAKLLRPARASTGLRSRSVVMFGGREETQSWARRLTLGFCTRLIVFFDEGLVVIMMIGPGRRVSEAKGCEGR